MKPSKFKAIWLGFVLLFVFIIGPLLPFMPSLSEVLPIENSQERAAYVETLIRPRSSFPLNLEWQVDLGSYTYDFPVYQNGLVFVPAHDSITSSSWYGINPDTGQIAWQGGIGNYNYLRCLTDEYLVVGGPYSFQVIEKRTGKTKWQKERVNTATCSEDAVFYKEFSRYSISAVDLETGQDLWVGTEPQMGSGGMVYNFETEELVIEGTFLCLIEPKSGKLKRNLKVNLIAPSGGPPWARGGSMYLIDRRELFAGDEVLDIQTGQSLHWDEKIGTGWPPTLTPDTMYVSALSDGVIAFDRAAYNIKWIYSLPSTASTRSPIAILNGIGYVILSDATLRAFELETGQELGYWQPDKDDLWNWRVCTYPAPPVSCVESAWPGLAASEDKLFVAFGNGKLYAFGK